MAAVFNGSDLIGYRDGADMGLTMGFERPHHPGNGIVHVGKRYTGLSCCSPFSRQEAIQYFIVTLLFPWFYNR